MSEQKEVSDYVTYIPSFINSCLFSSLLPILSESCKSYEVTMYNKTFPSNRISCVYTKSLNQDNKDAKSPGFSYKNIPNYEFNSAPQQLLDICTKIETKFNTTFDYVLVHVYRNHKDHIGYHNDKEALNTGIASVSLGSTRRFQFRPINAKKGYTDEYILKNGDLVYMHGNIGDKLSCQRYFRHQVPKMSYNDFKTYVENQGINVTGRASFNKLEELLQENNKPLPCRINLTFRQFE